MRVIPRLSSVPKIRRPVGSFRLVLLGAGVGVATGLFVIGLQGAVTLFQFLTLGFVAEYNIAFPEGQALWRVALSLTAGAVLISLFTRWANAHGGGHPIDAVEANALRGGKMAVMDGMAVVLPILMSVGVGASVGTEAAVTQAGAVLASVVARRLKLARSDLRLMVGAGAAAAISAAYQAPLAGLFYAFELVLGSYSKRTLAPVSLASITSVLTVWALAGVQRPFNLSFTSSITPVDYLYALVIGTAAAFVGVSVMLLVSFFERILRWAFPNDTMRRIAAGLVCAIMAARSPSILGSGHAAIERTANARIAGARAVRLLVTKTAASSVSLGGGYRGGLFSASLLIGALVGQSFAWLVSFWPGLIGAQSNLFALVGMAGVGASIIGSPLAIIFLVLETTGSFDATMVVAVGAVTGSFLTDRLFGYSFATWRFQQRGLAIESGQDVARLAATPIAGIVRPPKRYLADSSALHEVVLAVSASGARGTAVLSPTGSFVGLIDPTLVEVVQDEEDLPVIAAELVYATMPAVTPDSTLAEVLDIFRSDDRPTVAVVDSADPRKLVGCIRARDTFMLASSVLAEQRQEDLGAKAWGRGPGL